MRVTPGSYWRQPKRRHTSNSAIRSPQSSPSARPTYALDDELVPLPREVVLLGEQHRHPIESLIAELDHPPADGADQMLMVWLVACRLEATEALAEIALDDEPGSHHDIESAIDRRGADRGAARPELTLDLLGGHVSLAAEHDFGNRLPLRGNGQIVIAQVSEERV